MQSRRTLTLTLTLLRRERETFGGTVSGSPNRDPRQVGASSPLPARSGERIKVRGAFDCILTVKSWSGAQLCEPQHIVVFMKPGEPVAGHRLHRTALRELAGRQFG